MTNLSSILLQVFFQSGIFVETGDLDVEASYEMASKEGSNNKGARGWDEPKEKVGLVSVRQAEALNFRLNPLRRKRGKIKDK